MLPVPLMIRSQKECPTRLVVHVVLVVACLCESHNRAQNTLIRTQMEVVVLCVAKSDESTDYVDKGCMVC